MALGSYAAMPEDRRMRFRERTREAQPGRGSVRPGHYRREWDIFSIKRWRIRAMCGPPTRA